VYGVDFGVGIFGECYWYLFVSVDECFADVGLFGRVFGICEAGIHGRKHKCEDDGRIFDDNWVWAGFRVGLFEQ
jgi:hypothetical protein